MVISHKTEQDPIAAKLLVAVEAFLKRTGMSARAFSEAVGSSDKFVSRLRAGMSPRSSTVSACYAFMKGYRKGRK